MNRDIRPARAAVADRARARVAWLRRRRLLAEQTVAAAPVRGDVGSDLIELRVRITRHMANELEAGVPCRELRIERIGDDQAALLLYASNREQWLMNCLANAERAHLN